MESTGTFGSFIVTPANAVAVDAARRVAELPGAAYNPLVIVGGAGAGKTHLLHAIAAAASELRPGDVVLATTAAEIAAAAAAPHPHARLLLIDDVHQLQGAEACRIFGERCLAAISEGTQVVLALRGPAGDVDLAGNLDDLLSLGLMVEVEASSNTSRREGQPDNRRASAATEGDGAAEEARTNRVAGAGRPIWLDPFAQTEADDAARFDFLHSSESDDATRLEPSPASEPNEPAGLTPAAQFEGGASGKQDAPPPVKGPEQSDLVSPSTPAAETRPSVGGDEFGSFLADVSRVVAVAVENVPWRRKLAEGIAEWEGKGIRTDRLEAALEGDAPPDIDALLAAFARDAARLLEIRDAMGADSASTTLDNPDQLAAAETTFASWLGQARKPSAPAEMPGSIDPWFLDHDRLVLSAFDYEGRLPGDRR